MLLKKEERWGDTYSRVSPKQVQGFMGGGGGGGAPLTVAPLESAPEAISGSPKCKISWGNMPPDPLDIMCLCTQKNGLQVVCLDYLVVFLYLYMCMRVYFAGKYYYDCTMLF